MKPMTLCFAMLGLTGTMISLRAMANEAQVERGGTTADSKMRVGVTLVPTPVGRLHAGSGSEATFANPFTFAVMTTFDFVPHPNVFIGLAPSYTFHIRAEGADQIDPSREFDLLLRFGYTALVADRLHAYGYVAPGYSFISGAVQGAPSQGPVVGLHGGGLFDLTSTVFLDVELGYQAGFQQGSSSSMGNDLRASLLQIGAGIGVRI